eukprot:gnl/TRDRNA2_/TRDRNA2_162374_c0_seq1.p1 gnl/TRDRNA2_/TRDRNA2_162374_c0~~gnl/TRDRNA2_/TRDRNA2_162374_c0_seq1.p1  ORF type:complete len:433 (-),score=91.23 gnl/TRDRNA2_/TRDRNA2_162374_c0_seq1:161-1459(-)
MVSRLDDSARATKLAKVLHRFLREDLKLPLPEFSAKNARVETFGALLGIMRASNPLHPQKAALKQLKVRCPLTRRFPTTLTGKLMHYEDAVVGVPEIIDKDGPIMDEHKMWRLLIWIWLGNGGHMHQAWNQLKGKPCGQRYRAGDLRQPLEVIKFTIHAVAKTGALMRVIGSDGLDKKSRLAKRRLLYLCGWHEAVPKLVETFHQSPSDFAGELRTIQGLKGELTMKELLILISGSKYKTLSRVGEAELPFGQGAKNGAKSFLGIPLMDGRDAGHRYREILEEMVPSLEKAIAKKFPALRPALCQVTLGDIEPSLCGAFIYAKMIEKLRKAVGRDGRLNLRDEDATWKLIEEHVATPAGFIPHTREGRPEETSSTTRVPKVPYEKFRIRRLPSKKQLRPQRLLRVWGPVEVTKATLKKQLRRKRATGQGGRV